jgi:hypothetical protein
VTALAPECVGELARSVSQAIEAVSQKAGGDRNAAALLGRAALRAYQASSLAMSAARILRAAPAGSTGRRLEVAVAAARPGGAAEHPVTIGELAQAVACACDLANDAAASLAEMPGPAAGEAAGEMWRAADLLDAARVPLTACQAKPRPRRRPR